MQKNKFNGISEEEFRKLERKAYDGQLDFGAFPAAEYRYFDRMQDIGYRVRHKGLPKDFAREERDRALCDYRNDIDVLTGNVRAAEQYTASRVRMSKLVNAIYKEHAPLAKLKLALEFVELTVGEDGLAARNLSENYLEVTP